MQLTGCGTLHSKSNPAPQVVPEPPGIEETWGIEIQGIRYTAGGYMLDFRYRIKDPEKAAYILDRRNKAYLIDQSTGARFAVPAPAKVGPLRQTTRTGKPIANRTYFIFFANPGQYIKPGSKVSVVIGDIKIENLTVE